MYVPGVQELSQQDIDEIKKGLRESSFQLAPLSVAVPRWFEAIYICISGYLIRIDEYLSCPTDSLLEKGQKLIVQESVRSLWQH